MKPQTTTGGNYGANRSRRGGGDAAGLQHNNGSMNYLTTPGAPHNSAPGVISRRRRQLRAASNRYWRRVRAERRQQGFTTRGTAPKYELHQLFHLYGRKRKTARQRIYRARLADQGLTNLGKPKRGLVPLTSLDRAWREVRAGIAVPPQSFEDAYLTTAKKAYK